MNKFDRLRESMKEQGIEGVLLTSMENMQWYSGFSGDTGEILVTTKKQYFQHKQEIKTAVNINKLRYYNN